MSAGMTPDPSRRWSPANPRPPGGWPRFGTGRSARRATSARSSMKNPVEGLASPARGQDRRSAW